ncbi:ATP-dependent helicase HrpA [Paraperlucidibaca baekdonensis]|uniref:ATP-dependent helicase HrpA n=1 Tax=Paraperlucidibaca baekdonensis TaxID=748120 RepID=A0A3E0H309_9GAMM|nr:ATP-dependent RNA helicase HrpA [Paraperlucidibaca baekdonensis]REH36908.1 ATP-dependent helicase HrpA [Paraperlucidibaca baekdonensis]
MSQPVVPARLIPETIDWSADLPVLAERERLQAAIERHQVIIVAGETGSGKTTQLPKICLAAGRGRAGMIGHTQPRRIAARTVAQRIADELGTPLGQGVGFKVRFSDHTAAQTYLKVMTDGVLLAELARDRLLRAYDTLIIDEAHERSLNIDFLLGFLKTLLPKRPDLRVIITSATIDVARFSQHFTDAPVFIVEGRSYPVEMVYAPISLEPSAGNEDDGYELIEEALPRAVVEAVDRCIAYEREHKRSSGDILVFASSEREIRQLAENLRRFGPPHCEILPLYSRLSVAEQQKVFSRGAGRRIVIATNVAETSLTVPNIHFVIDPGFARISRYSYRSKVQRLPIEAVSQASANQRAGRCGRIAPGLCIRLYSEADFISRREFTDPEIQRTNLAAVILQMQLLKLGNIDDFPFLDRPDSRLVNDGLRLLDELGALDSSLRITSVGRQIAQLPLDPRLARMVIAAAPLGALHEVLVIVAALSVQDPRERPHDKQQAADERHAQFRHEDSDFLFFVNLWQVLAEQKSALTERQRREFARKHFLSWMRLREWRETYRQLTQQCERMGLKINQQAAPYEPVHRAMLTGLLSQIAHKTDEREYLAPRNQKALIFPGSVLSKKGSPWIMAAELVETHRVYLRMVAKITPEWIEHIAQPWLKRSYAEPHWRRKQGRVMAYEQSALFGLILHSRRLVNYEPIAKPEAREIFIRDALVTGDISIKAAFLQHNQALIDDVTRIEDKTRRRDLLVDEHTLFSFYEQRIPADVASQKTFEDWRHRIEKSQPQVLFLTAEEVLARAADEHTETDFPDTMAIAGHGLALSYHFEPGHDDDGVTLRIPAGLLHEVSEERLDWLVPGLVTDKVEALLRGLPKAYRRQLVPLPDTARQLMDQLSFAEGSLISALSAALRQRGVVIERAIWAEVALAPHFLVNMAVIGASRQVLAKGRDLARLRALLARQPEAATGSAPETRRQWERSGISKWDFPDLPEAIDTDVDGLPARAYPALQLGPQGLALKLMANAAQAQRAHEMGVAELLRQACASEQKTIAAAMKKSPGLLLQSAKWLAPAALEQQFMLGIIAQLLADDLPRTHSDFQQILPRIRARLVPTALTLLPCVSAIYRLAHEAYRQLDSLTQPVYSLAVKDMQCQLDAYDFAGFMQHWPVSRWQHYERYLQALSMRLEKLPHNVVRDDRASAELQALWQQWTALLERTEARGGDSEALAVYRWLLEEYRISLFAQPMKTAEPVSAKRLSKLWQTLTQ